jgi:hypothetical protein
MVSPGLNIRTGACVIIKSKYDFRVALLYTAPVIAPQLLSVSPPVNKALGQVGSI